MLHGRSFIAHGRHSVYCLLMDYLIPELLSVGSFMIKAAVVVISIIAVLAFALKSSLQDESASFKIKSLNKQMGQRQKALWSKLFTKKEAKSRSKKLDKHLAELHKAPKAFVIDFNGDIKASAVEGLRQCVTAIISTAEKGDEVILRLESPGGMVPHYGLAASQLLRLKQSGMNLTICIDKVAASGGYMMACLADKIIAAPFAIIGSIGVLAQVPNFNKILKKNDIDYYQVTAGKYKRTLTLFGEVSDEGLSKFSEDIESTHTLFKDHVHSYRPQLDMDKVATGEYWYGTKAKELALIDSLSTSDDHLFQLAKTHALYALESNSKKTLIQKFSDSSALLVETLWTKFLTKNQEGPLY